MECENRNQRTTRAWLTLLVGAFALLLSGCLPFAWATPPAQVEFGVAPRVTQADAESDDSEVDVVFPLRGSVNPLQLFPSLGMRHIDAGIGYQFVPGSTRPFLHGPFLEIGFLYGESFTAPADGPAREATVPRFGVRAKGHGLSSASSDGPLSAAGSLQLSMEWHGFHDNPLSGCQDTSEDDFEDPYSDDEDDEDQSVTCVSGLAYGESSIGFFVEGTLTRIGGRDQWWAGAGVLMRLPATMGLGVVVGDIF
ncbi:MAG: hypothetical protein ACLFVJ_13670 [Persicimonas sp.]